MATSPTEDQLHINIDVLFVPFRLDEKMSCCIKLVKISEKTNRPE